jgi:hypothetical protein
VRYNHVDCGRLMAELPFVVQQGKARAKAQSYVHLKEDKCFEGVLEKIVTMMEEAMELMDAKKKPFVMIGEHYGPSKCARGTRGHIATPLIKYLAQFLLLVKVPEHNTTKLCPLCHCETGFANKREIRSKVCKNCPVHGGDFFYDRDFGSASNIQYKAEFFVRSGGYYPAEYISIKERKARAKLFDNFTRAVRKARSDALDAGDSAVKTAGNSASGVNPQ